MCAPTRVPVRVEAKHQSTRPFTPPPTFQATTHLRMGAWRPQMMLGPPAIASIYCLRQCRPRMTCGKESSLIGRLCEITRSSSNSPGAPPRWRRSQRHRRVSMAGQRGSTLTRTPLPLLPRAANDELPEGMTFLANIPCFDAPLISGSLASGVNDLRASGSLAACSSLLSVSLLRVSRSGFGAPSRELDVMPPPRRRRASSGLRQTLGNNVVVAGTHIATLDQNSLFFYVQHSSHRRETGPMWNRVRPRRRFARSSSQHHTFDFCGFGHGFGVAARRRRRVCANKRPTSALTLRRNACFQTSYHR